MGYIKSEAHFVNLCCKQIRIFGIVFNNHESFVENLKDIYQLSENIQHLVYGNSLADVISWHLLHEKSTSKKEVLDFFNRELKDILSEAIDIYNHNIDKPFKYFRPVKRDVQSALYEKIAINNTPLTISSVATQELNKLMNCYGIYFLYNDKNQLIYIGKSRNLGERIINSIKERGGKKFAYILVKNPADIHILEPFLIIKYKPIKNVEFMEYGETSLNLEVPPLSNIISLFDEEGKK